MNIYKELRKNRNLTQLEMAKLIHVDQSTISKWEKGKAIPDIQTLSILSKFFNVSIDYILGKSNEITQPYNEKVSTDENKVIIYARGGGRKEITLTDKQRKAFEALADSIDDKAP